MNDNNETTFVFTNQMNSFIVNYRNKTCQPCMINNDLFMVNDTINVWDKMKDNVDEIIVDRTPYQLLFMNTGNKRIYY